MLLEVEERHDSSFFWNFSSRVWAANLFRLRAARKYHFWVLGIFIHKSKGPKLSRKNLTMGDWGQLASSEKTNNFIDIQQVQYPKILEIVTRKLIIVEEQNKAKRLKKYINGFN